MARSPFDPHRGGNRNLPSLDVRMGRVVQAVRKAVEGREENIPNAALIYGVAAAILFTIALYYLFTGLWLTGVLVLVLAVALFGYALVFLRYSR